MEAREIIRTEFGEDLSWEYLSYVRSHPIKWNVPTQILFGEKDQLTSLATMKDFVNEVKKAVRTTLMAYGATEEFVERYLAEPVIFTKSGNRKQLGLHKEMAQSLQWAAADYVVECHGDVEPLPAVMAAHMKDFLIGAPNYHRPGETTEKELMALGGWKDGVDEIKIYPFGRPRQCLEMKISATVRGWW